MDNIELKMLQSLDLETKIMKTKQRIREWYYYYNGEVYISFSGGKDSTVLLHLVRSIFPDVVAVFVDTGLEFPEIKEFVKTIDNVITLKPDMNFTEVINKYGYPATSKSVSMAISRFRNTKCKKQKKLRLYGGLNHNTNKIQKVGVIPKKFHSLAFSGIKISDKCCDVMKKKPIKKYEKETDQKSFIGTMAEESTNRRIEWLKNGCNAFDKKSPQSLPLSFWKEEDIWNYIKKYNIPYSKIYDMGYKRTG